MGQFALGLRSLLIKAAVFVVMAALLAWALGGTLWPRPQVAKFDSVSFAGSRWFWKLSVGGANVGQVRWDLMTGPEIENDAKPFDSRHWADVAGPIVANESLYFAGRASLNPNEPWRIERIDKTRMIESVPMPDRLAVEQQLARLAAGLPLQEAEIIKRQRALVLDPHERMADEHGGTPAQPAR
jgi:hypothetical protein